MSAEDSLSTIDSGKRSSSSIEQPPLKRLKEDEEDSNDRKPETDVKGDNGNDTDAAKDARPSCPTLKRSDNHGITEYVSKAHNGFFGECCLMLTCVGGFLFFFVDRLSCVFTKKCSY